jgi:hypothetical protein
VRLSSSGFMRLQRTLAEGKLAEGLLKQSAKSFGTPEASPSRGHCAQT